MILKKIPYLLLPYQGRSTRCEVVQLRLKSDQVETGPVAMVLTYTHGRGSGRVSRTMALLIICRKQLPSIRHKKICLAFSSTNPLPESMNLPSENIDSQKLFFGP